MALPMIIEDKEKAWLFKVITQTQEPELNACLTGFFLGSGLTTLEICRINVSDIVMKNGLLAKSFAVKGDVSRDFYLSNVKLQNLIKSYIEKRPKDGNHPDLFGAFEPLERKNGDHFKSSAEKQSEAMRVTTAMHSTIILNGCSLMQESNDQAF